MTPEQLRDERDAEMLAAAKQGWWVQCRWSEDRWPTPGTRPWVILLTPCSSDGRLLVWADSNTLLGGSPVVIPVESVTALHRPTDNPQMETAYKLHEPPTVTKVEAIKRLTGGWGIEVQEEDSYFPVWYRVDQTLDDGRFVIRIGPWGTWLASSNDTAITSIRSPGGNVYEVVENQDND